LRAAAPRPKLWPAVSDSPRTIAIVRWAGLAAWLAAAAIVWLAAPPLGHDEAQYAVAARDAIAGAPVRWLYLSVGIDAIALPGVLAGGGEIALRLVPAAIGIAFVLAAARLARGAFGEATAAWTVAVIAASFPIARRAAELLSDLPAAACLLAAAAILTAELAREPAPRWRLVLAAPCLAAAFYLRYGSALAIAAIGGAAIVAGWRAVLRRPWIAAAAIALFALLLVPHLLASIAATGSALGVLRTSGDAIETPDAARAIATYATANPLLYYGPVTAPAMLAGLVAIRRGRDRRVRLLWLMAVGDIVAVGMTPIAQTRYIFFGIVLLVILGVDELGRWISARRPPARRALGRCAAAAVALAWLGAAIAVYRLPGLRRDSMAGTLAAVAAIRDDARGAPCEVIARHTTQLQWYTGCVAVYAADLETLGSRRVYLVHEPGLPDQPDLAGRPGVPRAILARPEVTVTRYDPPP
jgi:hypothetical protein